MTASTTGVTGADIKGPEWEVLTDPSPPYRLAALDRIP